MSYFLYFAVGVGVAVVVAAAALGVAVVVDIDAAGVVGLTMFASVAAVCRGRLLPVFWTRLNFANVSLCVVRST